MGKPAIALAYSKDSYDPLKTEYACTACGAEDSDSGHNPPAPVALSCYSCGAGRGIPLGQMIQTRAGMFPKRHLEAV